MSKLVATALLLSLAIHGTDVVTAWDDEDFFRYCPPSQCSYHGPEIRFPFRLESSNTSSSCGAPCMKLACSGQDTILDNQYLGRFKVTAIDYRHAVLTIIPLVETLSPCPLQKLISTTVPVDMLVYYYQDPCDAYYKEFATLVCCSTEFTPTNRTADYIAGPISCLSTVGHFSYLVNAYLPISFLPLDCKGVSVGLIPIPSEYTGGQFDATTFKERAERILSFAETTVSWTYYESGMLRNCTQCELEGRRCAFSSARNQTFCMHHGIIPNWPEPHI